MPSFISICEFKHVYCPPYKPLQIFGCDGIDGFKTNDHCLVCGGDNSTCQVIEGVFTDQMTSM